MSDQVEACNKFVVVASYYCTTADTIELPDGKTIEDIKECWIKWGTLHCVFNDDTEFEKDMGCEQEVDWKRPSEVSVYPADEDGNADYSVDIAEELGV